MKKTLFICYFACQLVGLYAQTTTREFGKISQSEIDLSVYDKDKNAEAVVLFDIGKSYFIDSDRGFEVIFERHTRIKIFSEAGIKNSEIEIPFYTEGGIQEDVYKIEGITYNFENGQPTKTILKDNAGYVEKLNEYWNLKKFAMPDVKEGSVIEFRYRIRSQYLFNLRDWEFQNNIPTMYSEYVVEMIPFYSYVYLLQGANRFTEKNSYKSTGLPRHFNGIEYQDMINRFVMKDIPAFVDEGFMTSKNDYIIKLDFQLSNIFYPNGSEVKVITTWEEMIKELLKHEDFGKYIKKSQNRASKIFNIEALSSKPEQEKFDTVLNYVKANYNWNGRETKYASKSVADFERDKIGNSAEINLFTIGLLQELGIEAHPVIISTRDHGRIKYDYPFSHFFDNVIIEAIVDGKKLLTDATNTLCPNNRIPEQCVNDKGLVVKKDSVSWVSLQVNFISQKQYTIRIDSLLENPRAQVKILTNEYDAIKFRSFYSSDPVKIKKQLENEHYQVIDSSVVLRNVTDIKQPFILEFTTLIEPDSMNNKIYVSPFLNESITENPFKQDSRNYPIDIVFPKKRVFNTLIQIPDGYKAIIIPSNYSLKNDLFEMEYSTNMINNYQIQITFIYLFKKSVYQASDYLKLKSFYNDIIKKGNDKIILTKIQ